MIKHKISESEAKIIKATVKLSGEKNEWVGVTAIATEAKVAFATVKLDLPYLLKRCIIKTGKIDKKFRPSIKGREIAKQLEAGTWKLYDEKPKVNKEAKDISQEHGMKI